MSLSNDILVRDVAPILKEQLKVEAKKMNISVTQLAKVLLEKEMKEALFQSEVKQLTILSEQITHLSVTMEKFIDLNIEILELLKS